MLITKLETIYGAYEKRHTTTSPGIRLFTKRLSGNRRDPAGNKKTSLENGEDVLFPRFGKFAVKDKSSRRCRNPSTGEDMHLDAHQVVAFKCSGRLREKISRDG